MKINQTVCDVCGTVKGVTNHWHKASVVGGPEPNAKMFQLRSAQFGGDGKDICGQECATKLLQFWMATGSIDSPATKEPVSA